MKRRAVFIDKDGTLLEDVPYNVDPAQIRLAPGAGAALQILSRLDVDLFIITNQPGVELGYFPVEALQGVEDVLSDFFTQHGAHLNGFYYCPHAPVAKVANAHCCLCRKPAPGLILRAAKEHGIDPAGSWMIGDILHDIEAGRRAGCQTILINNGNETEWEPGLVRVPDFFAPDIEYAAMHIADSLRLKASA